MKYHKLILSVFACILFNACAITYSVVSDYEKNLNFSNYNTFQLVKQNNTLPLVDHKINEQLIDYTILNEMKILGFDTAEDPDILVSWYVSAEEIRKIDIYQSYYIRWNHRHNIEMPINNFKQNTLVVQLIDSNNSKIVWRGKIAANINNDIPDVEEQISEAVHAMLQKFAMDANLNRVLSSK